LIFQRVWAARAGVNAFLLFCVAQERMNDVPPLSLSLSLSDVSFSDPHDATTCRPVAVTSRFRYVISWYRTTVGG